MDAVTQTVLLISQEVALALPLLVPIIALCAGVKIVFDLIFDWTMGITGRNRGR